MPHDDKSYLLDILEAARLIQTFISDMSSLEFESDLLRQSAVIRQLEIVGEATKRLSEKFRKAHPDIPWQNLAGMRDILIHAYNHVDTEEVWNAAIESVPKLIAEIESIISD